MVERLRILHCLRAPVGGLFRHVRDLAREQAVRGHAVGVVCDALSGDPLTEAHLRELQPSLLLGLLRVPMSREVGPADVRATRAVRDLARRAVVDVLHGHGAKGGAYARFAARSLARSGRATAAVYTPHGGSLHYDPASLVGRAYMAAERHMARMTRGLIFESAYSERVFRSKVGVPQCPVRVVHNGLLPEETEPVEAVPGAADLLFIGELRRLKGVDVLLAALARVHRQAGCRLVVVGTGPDEAQFRAQAASLGLQHTVDFVGAMPARSAFSHGRILVLPSRAESLPYVVLEGAAAGLPLIASDVGGLPEIVGDTGSPLVPPGDPDALARAILQALEQPDELARRASRLRSRVVRHFTVARMADGILDFYADEVLGALV